MRHTRRAMVFHRRRLGAAQRADDPRQQHGESVAAGVHDARLAQHRQQIGAALDRLLAGLQSAFDHAGDGHVLLPRGGVDAQPRIRDVGDLGGDAVRHLAHDGEDRALGRVAHRSVGLIGGAGQRRPDEHRVHQLARPADQLLGGAADQLREDDPAVAAGAQQRRAGHRGHDLVTADVVDGAALGGAGEAVQFGEDRAQGQDHVVAGVAVGDGENVEVVDLLAARLQRRQSGPRPEPGSARCWDRTLPQSGRSLARVRPPSVTQRALVILPALRQRVHTYTRRGVPPSSMRTRWRFGSNRRFVATIEWLRLWPKDGPLAHTHDLQHRGDFRSIAPASIGRRDGLASTAPTSP